jgi:hypothetical protein
MPTIISHPQNALQAQAFTTPSSLSYGMGDRNPLSSGVAGHSSQQQQQQHQQSRDVQRPDADDNTATATTTAGGALCAGGIVPTLQ